MTFEQRQHARWELDRIARAACQARDAHATETRTATSGGGWDLDVLIDRSLQEAPGDPLRALRLAVLSLLARREAQARSKGKLKVAA